MSPQWTPPIADKQAWAPPASDRQSSAPRDHGDRLKGVPTGMPDTFMGTIAKDFAGIPEAAASAFTHPVDTVNSVLHEFFNLPETVYDMIKKGQGGKLAARTLEAAVPALSSERAALAAEQAGAVAKGALRGGMEGATETIPLNRYGVNVNVPAPVASAAAGAAAARMAGLPGTAGAVVGGAAPIVRGMVRGAREAMGPRSMPPSFTEPPINAWEAGAPEAATRAAPVAAEAITPGQMLAQEVGADWGNLAPADRAMLEQVAAARAAQPPPRPPTNPRDSTGNPQTPQPQATPQAAAPVDTRTIADIVRAENPVVEPSTPPIGAHQATPPVNGRGAPVRPPLAQSPQVAPTVEAVPPAVPAPPQPRTLPQVEAGMARTNPPAIDASESQTQYSPTGERKSPELIGAERTAANVAAKADRWAPVLHKFGITAEDLPNITPPQWEQVTAAMKQRGFLDAGENVPKSSIPEIAKRLKALETGTVQAKAAISPEPEAPAAPTGTPDLAAIPLDRLKTMKFSDLKALFPSGTPKADITAAIAQAMQKLAQ